MPGNHASSRTSTPTGPSMSVDPHHRLVSHDGQRTTAATHKTNPQQQRHQPQQPQQPQRYQPQPEQRPSRQDHQQHSHGSIRDKGVQSRSTCIHPWLEAAAAASMASSSHSRRTSDLTSIAVTIDQAHAIMTPDNHYCTITTLHAASASSAQATSATRAPAQRCKQHAQHNDNPATRVRHDGRA